LFLPPVRAAYPPIAENSIASGLSVYALGVAALQYSDNTALNLLLKLPGGSAAVNRFARSVGDEVFRLECRAPELNSALPTDERAAAAGALCHQARDFSRARKERQGRRERALRATAVCLSALISVS
jgi:beta-lactamase class A